MKRILFLVVALLATLFAFEALAGGGIGYGLMKKRMQAEARRSPLIGAEWKAHSMSAADIGAVTGVVYSGSAKTPTPTVTLNGTTLTNGTDFTFSYTNNVAAGDGLVTITAKKLGYYGSQTAAFTIAPYDLANATVSNVVDQTYTGAPVKPVPAVVVGATALVAGRDFDCIYRNNVQFGSNTAHVVVYGIGNYTGAVDKPFSIVGQ